MTAAPLTHKDAALRSVKIFAVGVVLMVIVFVASVAWSALSGGLGGKK